MALIITLYQTTQSMAAGEERLLQETWNTTQDVRAGGQDSNPDGITWLKFYNLEQVTHSHLLKSTETFILSW